MAKLKEPRVLFFTRGTFPTKTDYTNARRLSSNVGFRNAALVGNEPLEQCDAVAGAAPDRYKNAFPFVGSKKELVEKMGGDDLELDDSGDGDATPWGNT